MESAQPQMSVAAHQVGMGQSVVKVRSFNVHDDLFILFIRTALCTQECMNGGNCTLPDVCTCQEDKWTGYNCTEG